MEINIRDDIEFVEIWLTNSEKHDDAFLESLRLIFALCKSKKYKTAVFKSGEGSLFESTLDLLLSNKIQLAEKQKN